MNQESEHSFARSLYLKVCHKATVTEVSCWLGLQPRSKAWLREDPLLSSSQSCWKSAPHILLTWKPHLLPGCWAEASFSSLPHNSLHHIIYNMTISFPQSKLAREWKKESKMEVLQPNLRSGISTIQLYSVHYKWVINISPHSRKEIIQRCDYHKWDTTGSHLRDCLTHMCSNSDSATYCRTSGQ